MTPAGSSAYIFLIGNSVLVNSSLRDCVDDMTTPPPPVWPAPAAPEPSSSTQQPVRAGSSTFTGPLIAAALVGVVFGFAGSQMLSHSANLSGGIAGIQR